jgi:four helix bundle protein
MTEVYELDVYRLAEQLSGLVWDAYDGWTVKAQCTMGHQVIRSADSIAANLAEGYGRFTTADRKRFYIYARGSLEETKAWLRKAIRRRVIQGEEIEQYKALIDELGPKLNAFIRSTRIDSPHKS